MNKEETMTVPIKVQVTPLLRQGTSVYCDIDAAPGTPGKFVKGGNIKLPAGGEYDLTFELQPGNVSGLQFNSSDPFCSDSNNCPQMGQQNSQYSNATANGTTLTVHAKPAQPKNACHYRLNFADGSSCDPIIINGEN